MYINLVYKNDDITLCHKACKACWGKPLAENYNEMTNFIKNRVTVGHESVLEHSNVVIELILNHDDVNFYIDEIMDIMTNAKYLNIAHGIDNDNDYILIGGSIRAYKELIRYAKNPNSALLNEILRVLVANLDKCYFGDFIEAGLCDEADFYSPMYNYKKENLCSNAKQLKLSSVENVDNYNDLYEKLVEPSVYSTRDLYKMLTITINFLDMSRAATHQLVRHRNGITQSSMRYIDAGNAKFHIPPTVGETVYELSIAGQLVNLTFEDILKMELDIYEQLRKYGMAKEDARGILGVNTTSKDLYMTFTYLHFIKFLELRTDSHAQFEIRERALELFDDLVTDRALLPENLYDYYIPTFTLYRDELGELDDEIDEVIEIYEEEI